MSTNFGSNHPKIQNIPLCRENISVSKHNHVWWYKNKDLLQYNSNNSFLTSNQIYF